MTDSQILQVIGANVKKARLDADITQECLAELAGVHWQTISHVESGRSTFAVTTFARICQALEVTPVQLLAGLQGPDTAEMDKIKKALARKRRRSSTKG